MTPQLNHSDLWCGVLLHHMLDPLFVGMLVFLEQVIGFCLCW
jgi:hypothetical protein